MVRKMKKPILFCLVILLVVGSSSCGKKLPIGSSGYCSEVGQTRLLDNRFEVCLQKESDLAWFSEGPEIDILIAVGRSIVKVAASDTDTWEVFLNKLNLVTEEERTLVWENLTSTDLLAKSISKVSADNQRWDPLQISIGKYQSAEKDWLQALDDWSQLAVDVANKIKQHSFQERQAAMDAMNKASEKMESIFDYEVTPNLQPFISSKLAEIGLDNENYAAQLTLKILKDREYSQTNP